MEEQDGDREGRHARPERPAEGRAREEAEEEAVDRATSLSPRLVYEVVMREGEEELARPNLSLMFSGLAAGILISFSVIGEAVLRANLPDTTWRPLVENLGYSFGFILVILGRMQLFTENTITTVLPLFSRRDWRIGWQVARLWTIVLLANIVGAFCAAAVMAWTPALTPEVLTAVGDLSRHATGFAPLVGLAKAVPAGILIAALVWMLSAGDRGEAFFIILTFTWLIAAGDFTHVIAGSVEMAFLILTGELGGTKAVFGFFLPVLAGNLIGGTAVFTLLAWGQVREEVAFRDR